MFRQRVFACEVFIRDITSNQSALIGSGTNERGIARSHARFTKFRLAKFVTAVS